MNINWFIRNLIDVMNGLYSSSYASGIVNSNLHTVVQSCHCRHTLSCSEYEWAYKDWDTVTLYTHMETHIHTYTQIHTHKDIHRRTCTNTSTHILTWAAVITAIEQPSVPLVLHKSWSWMARLWHDYPIRHGDELVKETVKLFKGFYGIWQNKEMVTMQTDTQTAKIETGLTLKRSSVQSLAIRLNATWNNLPHVFVAVLQFQHKYQVVNGVSG